MMVTPIPFSRAPLSLDLGDIRKTQRRVAALLGVRPVQDVHNPGSTRRKATRLCPVCGCSMATSKGRPHVHSYDEYARQDDETSENLINHYVPKDVSGDIIIPSADAIAGETFISEPDRHSSVEVRDLHDLTSSDGYVQNSSSIPNVDANFVKQPAEYVKNYRDSKSVAFERNGDLSKKNSISVSDEISKLGRRRSRPKAVDLTGLGPWEEEEEGDYQTRDFEDEGSYSDGGDSQDGGVKADGRDLERRAGQGVADDSPSQTQTTGQGRFGAVRRNSRRTSSGFSADEAREVDKVDGVGSRRGLDGGSETVTKANGIWCECPQMNSSRWECPVCSTKGVHENWCKAQSGDCPDCGKPIKWMSFRRLRSSNSFLTTPSKTNLSLTSHSSGLCSGHGSSKQTTGSSWRGNKNVKNSLNICNPNERPVSKSLQIAPSKRYCTVIPGVDPWLPSFDPDLHRQAYLLALSDARVKQWRKDTWLQGPSINSSYFSYFPSWKSKPRADAETVPESVPQIGLRRTEGRLRIKDPMKHIFGSVKLSEYYPSGKRFPKNFKEPSTLDE